MDCLLAFFRSQCRARAIVCLALLAAHQRCAQASRSQITEKIVANKYWNATGVRVKKGHSYVFDALEPVDRAGRIVGLRDWFIPVTDLNGYSRPWLTPFSFLRRRPQDKWFAMIGTVDRNDAFRISRNTAWTAPSSGELLCYLNDCPLLYWNNYGYVRLRVTETSWRRARKFPNLP